MRLEAKAWQLSQPLDEASFAGGVRQLTGMDPRLAAVCSLHGPPPFWTREPGFPALLRIILEQQVSLASALAAYRRVAELANPLTPDRFLALDDEELRAAGFSRQKTAYGRSLSQALIDGQLDLETLHEHDDHDVRSSLTGVKGIGPWTAEVYLLMALRRPNAWPAGDLALATAAQEVFDLPARPGPEELELLGAPWQPLRAVAARILWHHYLSTPRIHSGGSTPPSDENPPAGKQPNRNQNGESNG